MSVAESSATGASGSARTTPVLNVVTAFAAHFHVRRGNEVVWSAGLHAVDQLSKQGVEWKVLPSGSHLIERDVIFFDVNHDEDLDKHGHLVGVAAFKNRKLGDNDRTGADVNDDDDQRGARMMAVGAIVDCGAQRTPWTQLAATLPHTCQLEKLVSALSGDPSCRNILQEWYDTHRRRSSFVQSPNRQINMDGFFYPHDPLLMLPAVSNALGPFLPCLIKSLLTAPFRLMLFVPPGTQSLQAASIALILAELVYTACQSPNKSSRDRCPVQQTRSGNVKPLHGLDVIGLVGLHDIDRLKVHDDQAEARGWIAYSSDRILLDKVDLYDGLLDLSPMMHSSDGGLVDATALPRFRYTEQIVGKKGQKLTVSRKQNWTTREFAVFRGLDERAAMDASSAKHVRKAISRKHSQSGSQFNTSSFSDPAAGYTALRPSSTPRPSTSTMIAFLTFWLSSLRFLPQRWRLNLRESYGYVPLSIRSDGGIRASIMLLPTSDDEDGDVYTDDEEEQDGESQAGGSHLVVPSAPSGGARQRSYSNALSVEGEEQQDSDIVNDPILAAVGAGSFAHRRRNSRSITSGHRSAAHLASEVASLHAHDGRPVSPELTVRRNDQGVRTTANVDREEAERDARESVRLALCLFVAWSGWVEDLVLSIQDVVMDTVSSDDDGETSDNNEGVDANMVDVTEGQHGSMPLLKKQEAMPITITPSQMSLIGLSSTSNIDVALVRFLASTVSDRIVEVERGWSILSWLCW
jgi:hypothetical protein